MTGVVECPKCDRTFLGDPGLCVDCEAKRDPCMCRECGHRMLVPVSSGLCGICDPNWVEHKALLA